MVHSVSYGDGIAMVSLLSHHTCQAFCKCAQHFISDLSAIFPPVTGNQFKTHPDPFQRLESSMHETQGK